MLAWTEKLELGIELIDNQHKDIFEHINKLLEAFDAGVEQEEAYEMLCFLEQYTHKHFSTEEFYFEKYNYKDLKSHVQLHRAFSKQLEDYKISHRRAGITKQAAMEIGELLIAWWYNHIINTDSKYVSDIGEKIN